VTAVLLSQSWRDRAACVGMDTNLFFPEPGRGHLAPARAVCSGCPVRADCADHAVTFPETFGVVRAGRQVDRPAQARRPARLCRLLRR